MKPRALFATTLAIASGGCWLTASFDAPSDGGAHEASSGKDASDARSDGGHPRGDASHRDRSVADVATDMGSDAAIPRDAGHDTSQVGSDSGVTCINATTYPASVLAAGAIAYWRLGDAPGSTTAVDQLGEHNGQYTSGVTFGEPGPLPLDAGVSVLLNGTTSEVLVSDGGFADFVGKKAYTLEAWFKPEAITTQYLGVLSNELVHDSGGKEGYVLFVQIDAGIGLDRYGTSGGTSGSTPLRWGPVSETAWTYVAGTYDPSGNGGTGEAALYVNGSLKTSMPSALSIVGGCAFAIGGTHCGTSGFFKGYIAEVALYDQVLDATCISRHYNLAQ